MSKQESKFQMFWKEISWWIYKSKNQFIWKNMDGDNNVVFERSCKIIVRVFNFSILKAL